MIKDLQVSRGGRPVVRGVDLAIPSGRITALLGPNGAGKSSLVLALTGVLPADSGSVQVDGLEVRGRRPHAVRESGLAAAPEGHRILSDLSVGDNLRVAGSRMRGPAYDEGLRRVLELFPELETLLNRRAGKLSGGQQQMVALGQALIDSPRFLVIDELSLGLAPVVVRRLAASLGQIAQQGVGVLLIEQFTTLALSLADRAAVMVRGRIQLTEDAETLRLNPHLVHSAYHLIDDKSPAQSRPALPAGH
ncbi:ABC transporter ATP-binding protein [Streptomyces sp. NPDC058335]|uniref:ABC transporter ATP-binding protein n=1 Tax=Streptomyces sp. NPDC058335 TaxID=3346451 RepID=UPI003649B6D2